MYKIAPECLAMASRWITSAVQPDFDEELEVPKVLGRLLEKLQHDFPAVPHVLSNLVPHQVNLWIGAASEGADCTADIHLLLNTGRKNRMSCITD